MLISCAHMTSTFLKLKTKLQTSTQSRKLKLKQIITQEVNQAFCFLNNNGTVYDLNPLYNSKNDYFIQGPDYVLNFNFCKNTITTCGNKTSLINYQDMSVAGNSTCVALSGPETVVSDWELLSKINYFNFR